MAEWCHSYITATQETTANSGNTKVHGAFLAICHAVFYLVAFKHHHLFSSKESEYSFHHARYFDVQYLQGIRPQQSYNKSSILLFL